MRQNPMSLSKILPFFGLLIAVLVNSSSADVPVDFTNEVVLDGFDSPSALAFISPTEMLVLEKAGRIMLVDLGAPVPVSQTFMVLPDVESEFERGLLNIVLDPDFANNGWFYLYYHHSTSFRFRVSRFTRQLDIADPSSEVVLWQDNSYSSSCCHFGGGLDIGPDGYLYLTTGEEFDGNQAADLTESGGKIHRFGTDGSVPMDNPFHDGVGPNVDTIWAYGLRNPFRAKWDLPSGRMFISEVGGNTQSTAKEDVHLGSMGTNYGWPFCEGACDNPDYPTCGCGQHDDPIYTYDHSLGQAIVGGFVYRGTLFPSAYDGAYFYADYASRWIRYLTFDPAGTTVTGSFEFETAAGAVVCLAEGPGGELFYCDFEGQVRRIRYDTGNGAPQIHSVFSTDIEGLPPHEVTFSGNASDPENDPLDKLWFFGDGQSDAGNLAAHTYTQPGKFSARWSVSDPTQQTLSDPIEIRVGQTPAVAIITPADGSLFRAGDQIDLVGVGVDSDGALFPPNFSWQVDFLHNQHVHPAYGPLIGDSASFTVPTEGHDFGDDTGYVITLTVTDADGLDISKSVTILPDKVDLSFDTVPSGLSLLIDDIPRTTPFVLDTLIDFQHTIKALPSACSGPDAYVFDNWSDAGAIEHQIMAGDVNSSFVANYSYAGDCSLPVEAGLAAWLKADFGISESAGAVSSWADGSPLGNNLVASGSPTLISGGLGGHDYIAFHGGLDQLARTDSLNGLPVLNADRSMFAVVRYHEVAGGGLSYGTAACNQAFGLSVSASGELSVHGWCPGNEFSSGAPATNAGWMVLSVVHSMGTFGHYKNGQLIDVLSHDFATVPDTFLVGASIDGTEHRVMDVAEILIYDRALDETERMTVESYLEEQYFGDPCDMGPDCNGNGISDTCELGNPGHGMRFRTGNWIDIPDQFLTGDFTLESWVNFPAPISNSDGLTCRLPAGHDVNFFDGRMRLYAGTDRVVANTPIVPDEWTHVALVRENDALSIYTNGVLDGTGSWTGVFEPEVLGRGRLGALTEGTLDEMRLWNVARSAAEILANMNGDLAAPQHGLLAAWRFDDFLIDQTVRDFSGNGLNGVRGGDSADETDDPVRVPGYPGLILNDDQNLDGIPDTCQLGDIVCDPRVSADGCLPLISYSGTPSLSGPDNFTVIANDVPGQVSGLALVGRELASLPAPPGGGMLGNAFGRRPGFPICIAAARVVATSTSAGTQGLCDGTLSLGISQADLLSLGFLPGDTLYTQIVFDDPAHPEGKGFSAALQFTLLP
ncbi:MAG: glucose/arabinose dehydrogenase [Planctomycetota bacterium]|jgi:glucose/arabinose dehydrogenase